MALVDPPVTAEPVVVDDRAPHRHRRAAMLGLISLGCALLMMLATVAGSLLAGTLLGVAALPLAVLAIVSSVAAVVAGAVAAVRGPRRIAGVVGLVLGVLLNPALLAFVLPGAS